MSLPFQAIDRLFARLHVTYGRDFSSTYEGLDMNTVKSSWAHELGGFGADLGAIAWALENLPPRCPNVIGFRSICRSAPVAEINRIEHSHASRERVAIELAKLGSMASKTRQKSLGSTGFGNKDWARTIIANAAAGIHSKSSLPLRMANAALSSRMGFVATSVDADEAVL